MAIIAYPTFLQPTPADIIGFNIQTTEAQQPRYVSWGQAFERGKVQRTSAMVAKLGTQTVQAQMDWKTRHPDLSVQFAVITVPVPAMPANTVAKWMLSIGGTIQPKFRILAALKNYNVVVTFSGGVIAPIDIGASLSAAIRARKYSYWMMGANAIQSRLDVPLKTFLHLVADVTAYADGTFLTDISLRNDYIVPDGEHLTAGTTLNYNVVISQNGASVFSATVNHYPSTVWRRVFHSLGAPTSDTHNVQRDIAYFIKSGALPNYDLTIGIDDTSIVDFGSTNIVPLSNPNPGYNKYFPSTGARDDIGLFPAWNARWIKSQDMRAAKHALVMANGGGSIPWHHFDKTTNDYVSLDKYPTLWIDDDNRGVVDLKQPQRDASWKLDNAHAPSVSFVPYMMTGERYFLDEINAQSSRQIAAMWAEARKDGLGIVMTGNDSFELRAMCWALRSIVEAQWANPDNRPAKAYWTKILENNYTYILGTLIPEWNAQTREVAGHFWTGGRTIRMYQQDFTVSVLALAATLRRNPRILAIVKWVENFHVGRFTHSAQGFELGEAFAYDLDVANSSGVFYDTWAELGSVDKPDNSGNQLPTDGAYWVALGLQSLAGIYNTTGNPQALAAYKAVKAMNAPGTRTTDYQTRYPQYHIVPKV